VPLKLQGLQVKHPTMATISPDEAKFCDIELWVIEFLDGVL
jgi:hypothetical protein